MIGRKSARRLLKGVFDDVLRKTDRTAAQQRGVVVINQPFPFSPSGAHVALRARPIPR